MVDKARIINRNKVIAFFAGIAITGYFIVRVYFFISYKYIAIDRLFAIFLFTGELYILTHAFGFIVSVLKWKISDIYTEIEFTSLNAPPVAIIVAARHEPKHILYDTFTAINNIDYPNKTIYLLDDSSEEKYIKEADEIAKEFNIKVFRREKRHGAKAGIVNDFIKSSKEKYIAIFDADQNPMPGFLKPIISKMEKDENIAFIQTPQFYTNIEASRIAKAATVQQAIFYEYICESKSVSNAMFCCGTNVVFRKSVLDKVGGFDEESITEDFATSVKIHTYGYKSLYYNKVCVFGMAPESLPAYFKQQNRWATGTISVFRKILLQFLKKPSSLTPVQWWEYFLASTYYFVGWAFFFLMISPITFLIFNIPSFFMYPSFYIMTFVPYYFLTLLIFYNTMLERHYNFKMVYLGTILGMLSFPVLMKSVVYGLINKKVPFKITEKGKVDRMSFLSLWPYHLFILLNIIAIIFGVLQLTKIENIYAIFINIFWGIYHIFILSHIYTLNRISKNL